MTLRLLFTLMYYTYLHTHTHKHSKDSFPHKNCSLWTTLMELQTPYWDTYFYTTSLIKMILNIIFKAPPTHTHIWTPLKLPKPHGSVLFPEEWNINHKISHHEKTNHVTLWDPVRCVWQAAGWCLEMVLHQKHPWWDVTLQEGPHHTTPASNPNNPRTKTKYIYTSTKSQNKYMQTWRTSDKEKAVSWVDRPTTQPR
jgi:hypothetical protein